jgi:cell division transport system permease protein
MATFQWHRNDLAFRNDSSARAIPIIVAVMALLACLALAGGLSAIGMEKRWQSQLGGVMTVQIPAPIDADAWAGDAADSQRLALRLLAEIPDVAKAVALDHRRSEALLTPWLGADVVAELPLARLIDIRLAADANLTAKQLQTKLQRRIPEIIVDDHRRWLAGVTHLTRMIAGLASVALTLVIIVTASVVFLAVRTGVQLHNRDIELMHIIGATDGFIAAQFQRHIFRLTLLGAVGGSLAAVVVILNLDWFLTSDRSQFGLSGIIQYLRLTAIDYAMLAAVPLITAGFAVIVTRVAVFLTLARLP